MWPLLLVAVGYILLKKSDAPPPSTPDAPPVVPPVVPPVEPPPAIVPAALDPYGVAHCITKEAEGFDHALNSTVLKDAQWALIALHDLAAKNASGKDNADGVCGELTRVALARFQTREGLAVTKYIDRDTYLRLRKLVPCAFQKSLLTVADATMVGRIDLTGNYVFVLTKAASPGNSTPYTTPIGQYELLLSVSKTADTGTVESGAPCPYGRITAILDNKLPARFAYLTPEVGDSVRLKVRNFSGEWVYVPWPLEA